MILRSPAAMLRGKHLVKQKLVSLGYNGGKKADAASKIFPSKRINFPVIIAALWSNQGAKLR